jgi:hypothetical protein
MATATPPHPELVVWLEQKLGMRPRFVAEVPGKLELMGRASGAELDPDRVLLDCLAGKGLLTREEVPNLRAMRALITDPLPKWLLLQKRVTEADLHQTFLEISSLPVAGPWNSDEVTRLLPILPPGFSEGHGCYALKATRENITIGLSQLLSAGALRDIHDRLFGYPLFFQAVSFTDAQRLREIATANRA